MSECEVKGNWSKIIYHDLDTKCRSRAFCKNAQPILIERLKHFRNFIVNFIVFKNCYKQCLNSGRASWQNRGGHNRWDNRTGANNWGNNRNKFQNRNNYGRNNYWRRNRYGNDGRCYTLSPLNRYFTFYRNQIAPLERHTRARHAPPNEETKFFATRTRPEMGCGRFCGSNTPL